MFARKLTAGLLACAGVLLGTTASQAGDVVRLNLSPGADAPVLKLGEIAPQADTFDVRGFHGGGGHGGGHGGGFYGRGHGGGFYGGGYRGGFYGGGYRGGFYGGGYRGGFYGGYGYYGGYRSYYGYPYYYSAPLCYPPTVYYYPISSVPSVPTTTYSLRIAPLTPGIQAQPFSTVQPLTQGQPGYSVPAPIPTRPIPADGTFDYDGGPRAPVPLPRIDPVPMRSQPTVPLDGRPVSLPLQATPKYTYSAYGEQPRSPVPADRTIPVSSSTVRRVQP
jgi:hypothetical protein